MKKEKKEFTKLTNKRGISLIVLIVTIIVIIILAAVVILTISKNNPIENAKEAKFKEDVRNFQDDLAFTISKQYTDKQGQRDTKINATTLDKMQEYIPSFTKEYEEKFVIQNDELIYVEGKVTKKEIKWCNDLGIKSNSNVPADWKQTIATVTEDGVPVPKGFTYKEGTKETGTVIQDELGNEFVWIPATVDTYIKDFSFSSEYGATSSNTSDGTLPAGITDETADVEKYGGFYISRYEAGIPTGDTSPSNKTGIPVSKKGATVWTDIDYTNAKVSAESMISTDYVQSGLPTGRAWDRICHFIAEGTGISLTDSRTYGNYKASASPANITGHGIKQVAGFSDKWSVKNIYDLAGNVWEWTNEVYSSSRVGRGGGYGKHGGYLPVSHRNYGNVSGTSDDLGFHSRLYIK